MERTRLPIVTAVVLAASACGGTGGTAVQGTAGPSMSPAAGSGAAGAYDANRLKKGLLSAYGTARPVAAASAGTVGDLQDRLGLTGQLNSIKTRKHACLTAGPNLTSPGLREVPASAITLIDKRRGYTLGEVLFSADQAAMRKLIARRIPPSCRRLTARVSGTTVHVRLRPIHMPRVSRTINGVMMTVAVGRRVQRSLTVMFATRHYGGTLSLSGHRVNRTLLRHATVAAMRTARRALT